MGEALNPYKQCKTKQGVDCTYYRCQACPDCPLANECVKGKDPYRSIARDEHEPLREAAARRMATPEGKAIYKKRAPGIEGVFGIIKSCLGIRRFSLRGLDNVRMEWNWICTAYNLKKLLALTATDPPGKPQNSKKHSICTAKPRYKCIMRVFVAGIGHTIRHQILRARQAYAIGTWMKYDAAA